MIAWRSLLTSEILVPRLLRIGLALVFLYAGVASFVDPREWVGYLPVLLTEYFPTDLLLTMFAVYELALATWLLSGIHVRYAGLVCAATLAGIMLANPSLLHVTFRDIGLLFAALALAVTNDTKQAAPSR